MNGGLIGARMSAGSLAEGLAFADCCGGRCQSAGTRTSVNTERIGSVFLRFSGEDSLMEADSATWLLARHDGAGMSVTE